MTDELIKAVKHLIIDIESMQERPQTFPEQFGPFKDWDDEGREGITIHWPNLGILLADVKKLLEPITIEGELTKSQIARNIAEERGLKVVEVKMIETNAEDMLGLPNPERDF